MLLNSTSHNATYTDIRPSYSQLYLRSPMSFTPSKMLKGVISIFSLPRVRLKLPKDVFTRSTR